MQASPFLLLTSGGRSACFLGGMALLSLLPADVVRSQSIREEKPLVSQAGFVFLDGEYIPPPYVIKGADSSVEINGQTIQLVTRATQPMQDNDEDWDRYERGQHGSGGRPRRRDSRWQPAEAMVRPMRWEADLVAMQLDIDGILVVEKGKEVSFLCHERQIHQFLKHLLGMVSSDQIVHRASNPSVAASQRVKSARFSPTPELVNRARRTIARIDASDAEDVAAETGLERLSMFAFPLTVAGMILAVLASGHLITYPPRPIEFESNARVRQLSERATVICLALLVALSGLDLAWTLLASQAGQMIELNPVGSRMVDDPSSLIAFKVSLTLASGGILFAFRRRHSARVASWWLCMMLTLLTFRWLVFNSMQAA